MFSLSSSSRILIAPAPFKGSLSSAQAAEAIAAGLHDALPTAVADLLPLADGGEGLVRVLAGPMNAGLRHTRVHGPLPGQTVEAEWAFSPPSRTAIIEMAAAAGLGLVPPSLRSPLSTTTFGVGELVLSALDAGAERIVLGLGGSATNDAGAGMAEALGVCFLDKDGNPLPRGGAPLALLDRIDCSTLAPGLARLTVVAAVDVRNPLTGPEGATAVYGPQKGLRPEDQPLLEHALENFARIALRDCHADVESLPGAGAAGGMGAAVVLFFHGKLRPGIEIVLDALRFDDYLRQAALVITGEGSLDAQTRHGKVIAGVLSHARSFNVPVAAIAGAAAPDVTPGDPERALSSESKGEVEGLADLELLTDDETPVELAMRDAAPLLRRHTTTLILRHL